MSYSWLNFVLFIVFCQLAIFHTMKLSQYMLYQAIFLMKTLILSMKSVNNHLIRIVMKNERNGKICDSIFCAHYCYVYNLLYMIKINKYIIDAPLKKSVIISFLPNVIAIIAMHFERFDASIRLMIILTMVIRSFYEMSFVLFLIKTSSSLTLPARMIRSGLIKLHRSEVRFKYKFVWFYEIINHRKVFAFTFSPMGKISRKSLLSFVMFYFAALMYFTTHYTLKQF